MAVDIAPSTTSSFADADLDRAIHLSSSGYYWYLYPLFKDIQRETGQMIDLYGDAVFSGNDLNVLLAALRRARDGLKEEPEKWDVHIGTQTAPVAKEFYATVTNAEFRQLLAKFIHLVESAIDKREFIVCFGD